MASSRKRSIKLVDDLENRSGSSRQVDRKSSTSRTTRSIHRGKVDDDSDKRSDVTKSANNKLKTLENFQYRRKDKLIEKTISNSISHEKENVKHDGRTIGVDDIHSCTKSKLMKSEKFLDFNFDSRKKSYVFTNLCPSEWSSRNILHHIHMRKTGLSFKSLFEKSLVGCTINSVKNLHLVHKVSPFDRRVTALEWHPNLPCMAAVGSKGGDIILMDTEQPNNHHFIKGIGAGGIINALKFWAEDKQKVVSASVDGTVTLHDFEGRNNQILADTMDAHSFWYCSVDVNPQRKLLAAGDNVGNIQLMSYVGEKSFKFRLHKNKVTHLEFSPREEWLLCSASTDQTVQMWDIRMMKDRNSSLCILKHDKPVNSAYFSKTDGCRLLTTDQNSQIRVYRTPMWHLETTILHPHRFFQHITPFKASWHPLVDLAVIGRYPDPNMPQFEDMRTIDIIDVASGKLMTSLNDPTASGLFCLNAFNKLGTELVSGMGLHILVWKFDSHQDPQRSQDAIDAKKKLPGNTGPEKRKRKMGEDKKLQKKLMDSQTREDKKAVNAKLDKKKKKL